MKRLAPVLMIFLMILCSCSKESAKNTDEIRDHYRLIETAQYTVTQKTDFGDRVIDFSFTYNYARDGDDSFEVTAPEAIKGISAVVSGEGASVEFEGMLLELGRLPGTGLSPLEVIPFMFSQWRDGYVSAQGSEKLDGVECSRLTYKTAQSGVSVEHHAWFDPDTFEPVRAELFFDGAMVASCVFS